MPSSGEKLLVLIMAIIVIVYAPQIVLGIIIFALVAKLLFG